MPKTAQFDVTILNGEAVGLPPLDLRNYQKGSIRFPSAWTAADLGFKIIGNDASEILLEDSSANVIKMTSIPTAAASWRAIPADVFSARVMKLVSINTATEADENQGAERALEIYLTAE
jgi:hypothetical protein